MDVLDSINLEELKKLKKKINNYKSNEALYLKQIDILKQ